MPRFNCAAGIVLLTTAGANAQLTLSIDTDSETFALSGMDSGTTQAVGLSGIVQWRLMDSDAGPIDSILTLPEIGEFAVDPAADFNVAQFAVTESSNLALSFVWFNPVGAASVEGLDVPFSYASFSPFAKSLLASSDGATLTVENGFGSGFAPLQVSVVPAPGAALLLAGPAMLLCRRRRKA